jgi:polyvinyl alcohol dehydrogenase (cytochrome)
MLWCVHAHGITAACAGAGNARGDNIAPARSVSSYDHFAGSISRVTPAVDGGHLILGDRENSGAHQRANVMSVSREDGELNWITQVDSHPAAIITGSPVVYNGVVYVGVSSTEETLATNPNYPCCTFLGSIVALNGSNGAILWKTRAVPDGYSGGALWQPPAIDPARGSLFAGTGNNYSVPPAILACPQQTPTANCTSPDDHFDSAMALGLASGAIKWATGSMAFDTWAVACTSNPPGANCPLPASPDYDFSWAGPNLVGNIVGFGQKSGIYWAFNPDNGNIVWSTMVGPGGTLGGMEWGTATDGQRIYAPSPRTSIPPTHS